MSRLARVLLPFFDVDDVMASPLVTLTVTSPGYIDVVTGAVVVALVDVASTVSVAWCGAAVDLVLGAVSLAPDDRRVIVFCGGGS